MTRWGILSTARINGRLIEAAKNSPAVEIAAVASRDRERARAYAREHRIEHPYGSYEELLADPDLDAVYISLPNSMHVEWSKRALQAGKHVLCEKPLSRRAVEVEALFDTADRCERLCMEAFMWRHNTQTKRLSALVAEGAIGELRLVRAGFSFLLTDPANVRMRSTLDGGALMDVGCYCVSGIRLLAGEPQRVTAQQLIAPSGVDVRLTATLVFGGGAHAHFDSAFDLPDRSELQAIGSEGSIDVSDPWHCRAPGITLRRGDHTEQIELEPVDSYQLELENFSAAIGGRAAPLLGRVDAVGQARTIEALYRSAESGRAVELP
jgi:D-xylose 1-dehydrogenase (NADP+, D-xylono-1,5-lactone-forming)